ncbi:MAG TPA: hypothetical protein ENN08_03805 [Bacteroidales bacterium]|nr:hypothetical protein [Bacteroidales bacterium]
MKTLKLLYLLTALIIVMMSCKKDEPPEVETLAVNDITHTSALGGGLIINLGSEPILQYGLCWRRNEPNPTIEHNKSIIAGAYLGEFTILLDSLRPVSMYYVSINQAGISYGQQITFITSAGQKPEIITSQVIDIGVYSALSGGIIVNEGTYPVTKHGICWTLANNGLPTINHDFL